jgi:hypothetical protein
MHAPYYSSFRNPGKIHLSFDKALFTHSCQLLETAGIISSSNSKSAASDIINYQDSATDPFGEESEEAASLREDKDEATDDKIIDMNAVSKVS